MPKYTCDICNFCTTLKGNYTEHLNTFKHNRNLESSQNDRYLPKEPESYSKFKCEYCCKEFTSKAIMKRHIKNYCKVLKHINQNAILLKRIEKLEEKQELEKRDLYKKIDKLIEKLGGLQS
jgi:hypothetical protein